eukprot:g18269.t1
MLAVLASECWKDTWGAHNFARCCLDQVVANEVGCWTHLGEDPDRIDAVYQRCCLNIPYPPRDPDDSVGLGGGFTSASGPSWGDGGDYAFGQREPADEQLIFVGYDQTEGLLHDELRGGGSREVDVVTFPTVLSRQETLAILHAGPDQLTCGCRANDAWTRTGDRDEDRDSRFFCKLHRRLSMTEGIPSEFVREFFQEATIAELADCPFGALALSLAIAQTRAPYFKRPLDSAAFVYAENALFTLTQNARISLKHVLQAGWDFFHFVDLMRQHYVQNVGILRPYLGWECMELDAAREEFMYDNFARTNSEMVTALEKLTSGVHDEARGGRGGGALGGEEGGDQGEREDAARGSSTSRWTPSGSRSASPSSSSSLLSHLTPEQDPFFLKNQVRFLVRDERRVCEKEVEVQERAAQIQSGAVEGPASTLGNATARRTTGYGGFLTEAALLDVVAPVAEPPRSLWNVWRDFTHIDPREVRHRGLEFGARELQEAEGDDEGEAVAVEVDPRRSRSSASEPVPSSRSSVTTSTQQEPATALLASLQRKTESSFAGEGDPLRYESRQKCFFVEAYAFLQMYQNLEASADMGLNAAAVFELGEKYLREQLLFTKGNSTAVLAATGPPGTSVDVLEKRGRVGDPRTNDNVVQLRRGVKVRLTTPSSSTGVPIIEPLAESTSRVIRHHEAFSQHAGAAAAAARMNGNGAEGAHAGASADRVLRQHDATARYFQLFAGGADDWKQIFPKGFPRPDVIRKLIYTSININGLLAQLSQYRRVWVSDGGRHAPAYFAPSRAAPSSAALSSKYTSGVGSPAVNPSTTGASSAARPAHYFRMQVFPLRELASTYIRYKHEPFCNQDPFRELLQTVDPTEPWRIVEGGAHLGDCALLAASLLPRARITAIEPLPDAGSLLQTSVALNADYTGGSSGTTAGAPSPSSTAPQELHQPWSDRFQVVKVALDSTENCRQNPVLELTHLPGRSASASAHGGGYVWNCKDENLCKRYFVPKKPLDELVDFAHIVKLSIQGNEVAALQGSTELMERGGICSWMMYFGKINLGTTVKVEDVAGEMEMRRNFTATVLGRGGGVSLPADSDAQQGGAKMSGEAFARLEDCSRRGSESGAGEPAPTAADSLAAQPDPVPVDIKTTESNIQYQPVISVADYSRCVSIRASRELYESLEASMDIFYVNYGKKLETTRRIRSAFDLHSTMQSNLDLLEKDEDAFWKEYLVAVQKTGRGVQRCTKFVTHIWRQFRLL